MIFPIYIEAKNSSVRVAGGNRLESAKTKVKREKQGKEDESGSRKEGEKGSKSRA